MLATAGELGVHCTVAAMTGTSTPSKKSRSLSLCALPPAMTQLAKMPVRFSWVLRPLVGSH